MPSFFSTFIKPSLDRIVRRFVGNEIHNRFLASSLISTNFTKPFEGRNSRSALWAV